MRASLWGGCVCLVLAACGGGGGDGGSGGASTSPGSGSTAPVVPVPPVTPLFTYSVQLKSFHAVPLGNNRVLLNNRITTTLGTETYPQAMPSFLVWDTAAKKITAAFKLTMSDTDLVALLGPGNAAAYSYNLTDLRPTPDGGVVLQFDLFGPSSDPVSAKGKAQVIAKLGADFTLSWSKVWLTEQYGALEVRSDGYVSTGASVLSYDLNGTLTSSLAVSALNSTRLDASTSVLGLPGGYALRRADNSIDVYAGSQTLYASTPAVGGGVALAGYGSSDTGSRSVVTLTDAQGLPLKSVSFDYSAGQPGFRDITQLGGNYYVLGARSFSSTPDLSDWVVCRLSASLDAPQCIAGRQGNSGSNLSIRADEAAGRIYVANHAANAPVLVLAADLKPVVDPGYVVDSLTTTVSPWSMAWVHAGVQTPPSVSFVQSKAVLGVSNLAVGSIDLAPLAGLLK